MLGFTIIFMALGLFAGTLGSLLVRYKTALDIIAGAFVTLFGLSFLGLFEIPFFKGTSRKSAAEKSGFFTSLLFGMIFSVSWTPCIGAFLGSALMRPPSEDRRCRECLCCFATPPTEHSFL